MFGFVKWVFISAMMFFGCSLPSVNSLKCISMKNQECKVRPQIVNVNGNEPVFFPFSIKTSKCSGSCYNINNPYAKLCVFDVAKNLNVRAFNLMSRTNVTRHREWHETCKCKCRLDGSICNNKQRWNDDKCRCEYKELIDKGVSDEGFIWNPSNFECECDKSCEVGEHLDHEKCICRKKLVDKSVNECTGNVEELKLAKITLSADENEHKCSSCTLYIVLCSVIFIVNVGIGTYFIYFHWYLKKDVICIKFGTRSQTNRDQKSKLLFLQRHDQSQKSLTQTC